MDGWVCGWWRKDKAEISHQCGVWSEGWRTDGWTDGDLSALCLALCQISALMEIPSVISAAEVACLCRHVVNTQADFVQIKGEAEEKPWDLRKQQNNTDIYLKGPFAQFHCRFPAV